MAGNPHSSRTASPATGTRLVMAGAFVGAILILALTTAFSWRLGAKADASPQAFDAPTGACLDWKQPNAADMHIVNCARQHRFQVTGKVTLNSRPGAPLPNQKGWQQVAQQRCTKPAEHYLGGPLDPQGRYSVGALKPTAQQWKAGDRTLRCGLQVAAPSGKLLLNSGSAKAADQSALYPVGTCLGLIGKAVGDPVNCSKPHSYEIVGIVDLKSKFTDGYPGQTKQQNALLDLCSTALHSYAHGVSLKDYGLTLTWDTRSEASWKAGSTQVNCKVGAPLSDGSGLKPITNTIKR
ncbi:MAG: septum formation family protein [Sciscionella sp.]